MDGLHLLLTSNHNPSSLKSTEKVNGSPAEPSVPFVPLISWVDQPTTQAGHARTRVFVACQACRSRKIKCDGLKPVCTNCVKKSFAPGPSYQHLLPANERHKLANGICLYDQLPKRRGPDRLPGARVRKRSRADISGHERVSRRRSTGAPRQSTTPPEQDDTFGTALDGRNELFSRSGEAHNTSPSNGPHEQSLRRLQLSTIGSSSNEMPLPVENIHSVNQLQPDHSRMVPHLDMLSISPPESASSSDEFRNKQRLLNSSRDAMHTAEFSDIPTSSGYRTTGYLMVDKSSRLPARGSLSPPSESPVARLSRGGFDGWNPLGASGYTTYPAKNPSYEYVSSSGAYIQALDDSSDPDEQYRCSADEIPMRLSVGPGSSFVQKTWFDALLDTYASLEMQAPSPGYYQADSSLLTSEARHRANNSIISDLRHFFARSSWWFSFIHVPTFWARLYSPDHRTSSELQPALLLSALCLAVFFKSNEREGGAWGRERAARLKAKAEAAVESSLAVGWVDLGLAQAAWFLAMYELNPHPYHSLQKTRSAFSRVDSILRLLKCTSVDADNPAVTRFDSRATPLTVNQPSLHTSSYAMAQAHNQDQHFAQGVTHLPTHYSRPSNIRGEIRTTPDHAVRWSTGNGSLQPTLNESQVFPHSTMPQRKKECRCHDFCLGKNAPEQLKHTPLWHYTANWAQEHEPGEIKREEARRIVWSFITIASSLAGHTASLGGNKSSDIYWSTSAENLAVLYPGEAAFYYDYVSGPSSHIKDSVWALYARAQLLWLACLRMRDLPRTSTNLSYIIDADMGEAGLYSLYSTSVPYERRAISISEAEVAEFTLKAWIQTQEIEEALDAHTCNLERTYLFHGREHLFTTRMTMSQEFSRYIPFPTSGMDHRFNRPQADDWLKHQSAVATSLMAGMHHVTGQNLSVLADRPYFVWWFMIHVVRLLNLWARDHSMKDAVQLCFAFLPAIDYLTSLWPSENQRNKYLFLRRGLDDACLQCGIPLATPPALPDRVTASSHLQ